MRHYIYNYIILLYYKYYWYLWWSLKNTMEVIEKDDVRTYNRRQTSFDYSRIYKLWWQLLPLGESRHWPSRSQDTKAYYKTVKSCNPETLELSSKLLKRKEIVYVGSRFLVFMIIFHHYINYVDHFKMIYRYTSGIYSLPMYMQIWTKVT